MIVPLIDSNVEAQWAQQPTNIDILNTKHYLSLHFLFNELIGESNGHNFTHFYILC